MKKSSFLALALAALAFTATGAATAHEQVEPRISNVNEVATVTAYRYVGTVASFKLAGQPLNLTAADQAAARPCRWRS